MKLKPYPSYKDSGVEWLGQIPSGWNSSKIRFVSECLDGKRVPLNSEERAERTGDIPYWGANSIVGYVDEALFNEPLVLLGEDGAPFFDKDKPVAFYSEGPVWPNNHVHVLRIKHADSAKFIVHVLNAMDYADYINGTTRDKLTQSQMNNIPLPLPDSETRNSIVTFIDRETGKLDTLISKQEKLIELLQEKRQAIISHAVTKGLDPKSKMKDSKVDWLGMIPADWDTLALRRILTDRLTNGIFKKKDQFGSGTLLVNVFDIYRKDFKISYTDLDRVECSPEEIKAYRVLPGDLFFVRSSLKQDGIAVSAIAEQCQEDAVFECHLIRARIAQNRLYPRYASYLLNCHIYRSIMISSSKITTMTTIDQEGILSTIIPLPSLTDQMAISKFIDDQTEKIDILIKKATQSIELAKEHRTALISAAVTGKVDVREAA